MSYTSFRNTVWRYYRAHGRHDLPWRKTRDPYKVLVSEVMLQQTQVERVAPFYTKFLNKFPTAEALAEASLRDVLAAWQGLGYNRRARLLREAARQMQAIPISSYRTKLVCSTDELVQMLEELPGVGPYTARAVMAFAYNADVVFIETNIRTAVIHHFFNDRPKVSDREVAAIVEAALPKGRAREWYSALMDYGAHLKRSGVKLNARSAGYAKQAKFEGSIRQVRGAILAAVTKREPLSELRRKYPDRFDKAVAGLEQDGMIKKSGRTWRVA